MSDPIPTAGDFLAAESAVDHLLQNRTIQFQVEGDTFDRAQMQIHVNERAALIVTKQLLLDEVERLIALPPS